MYDRKCIAILLAAYNSSKFINRLIDSILIQSHQYWKLYIRDDGSSDDTMEIIRNYERQTNKIILLEDETIHRGAKGSFIWLMEQVESEYYMFCDHDDVWMPDKIERTVRKMDEYNQYLQKKPIIIHTDLVVVNECLETLYPSFWKFSHASPETISFAFHCAYNNVTGCTMLFNKMARDLSLSVPREAYMHDAWVALVVAFHKGIIDYVREPTIYYRQHDNNTLGSRPLPSFLAQLSNLKNIAKKNRNQYKAITSLKKISFIYFLANKLFFYVNLKLSIFLERKT